jgi:hypothetical protein
MHPPLPSLSSFEGYGHYNPGYLKRAAHASALFYCEHILLLRASSCMGAPLYILSLSLISVLSILD